MSAERTSFEVLSGPAAQAAAEARACHAFQSGAWVQGVAAARARPHRFVAVRCAAGPQAGAHLFGGVHRRFGIEVFESMPMAGYGGWCLERELEPAQEVGLHRAWLAQSPWRIVSLTSAPGREASLPAARLPGWLPARWRQRLATQSFQSHILSLEGDDEALLQRARPRVRTNLRRVDQAGFTFELGGDGALAEFCTLFLAGSQAWKQGAQGLMPDGFFHALHAGGIADVWRVSRESRCVAAAMFLRGRSEVFYQASGTTREQTPVSATDALMWTVMRHYRDRGFRTLNLGASEGLDSVRAFKEKLGATAASYGRATYLFPAWSGPVGEP